VREGDPLIEIEVKGFQSIDHTRVEVTGFTALVGRSNVGKSAIVRAVKAALTNTPGNWFVRHGATCARIVKGTKGCKCQSSVHIRMPGLDLLWEKGDAITSYTVNGKVLTALERGVPDFMSSFGLSPTRIGDSPVLLQIAEQFAPLFLMRESGASVANVLSDVARLDAVNEAVKLAEKDRREAVTLRKTREKDVQELTEKVAGYNGLDDLDALTSRVEVSLEMINATELRKATTVSYIESLSTFETALRGLIAICGTTIPSSDDLRASYEKLSTATSLNDRYQDQARTLKILRGMESIPSVDPTKMHDLAGSADNITEMLWRLQELVPILKAGKALEGLPELKSERLEKKLSAFTSVGSWFERTGSLQELVGEVEIASGVKLPEASRLTSLVGKNAQAGAMAQRLAAIEDTITDLKMEIDKLDVEAATLQQEVDAMGVCPTCARPLHFGGHPKEPTNGKTRLHLSD
jgi:DNA repair ATPase RecN